MRSGHERLAQAPRRRALFGLAALLATLSLGGCGRLNRTATIGSAATGPAVAGATVAAALQHQLATSGVPAASVTCARKVLVHVGTTTACSYQRAGRTEIITFRFADKTGTIAAGSVSTR